MKVRKHIKYILYKQDYDNLLYNFKIISTNISLNQSFWKFKLKVIFLSPDVMFYDEYLISSKNGFHLLQQTITYKLFKYDQLVIKDYLLL